MKILNFANAYVSFIHTVEDLGSTGDNIEIKSTETLPGGRGYNISLALLAAGFSKVYHAGILGANSSGLLNTLKANNVNVSCVKTSENVGGYSLILADKYGRKRSFYRPGAEMNIDEAFIDNTLKRFQRAICSSLMIASACVTILSPRPQKRG